MSTRVLYNTKEKKIINDFKTIISKETIREIEANKLSELITSLIETKSKTDMPLVEICWLLIKRFQIDKNFSPNKIIKLQPNYTALTNFFLILSASEDSFQEYLGNIQFHYNVDLFDEYSELIGNLFKFVFQTIGDEILLDLRKEIIDLDKLYKRSIKLLSGLSLFLKREKSKTEPNRKYSIDMFNYTSELKMNGLKDFVAHQNTLKKFGFDIEKFDSYGKQYRAYLKNKK